MKSITLTIVNKLGLHARASAQFVKLASQFKSEINVTYDDTTVNGKSIMGLLTLAASCGTSVTLSANGPDEDESLTALQKLFAERFGETE